MDKKSIIGIAVVAVLFLGFAYFNSRQQKEYLEQKAAYEAYVDSVAAAARAAAPVADSLASGNGVHAQVAAAETAEAVRERQVETLGESLTAAREAEEGGLPFWHRLCFLVIHGVLHITGYDHERSGEAEARRMEEKERELFALLEDEELV